jgi:DHA1 family bicyclomycin/chloramphenicol resistance-like MFS transporter
MLRPDTFALTALLALITALGPVSTDMYLPSMPDIGRLLAAPPAQVQLTLSAYLATYALGQVAYGPVSDRYGRRPVLLFALALFCLANLACALAPSIEALIAARAFQALGGSGAIVVTRAIVRDLYVGARAGRELSLMGAIMALAPILAPLLGGVLQTAFGWRANFLVTFAVGLIATLLVWRWLPETLSRRASEPLTFVGIAAIYRGLVRNRAFLAYLGIVASSFAGLFAWISGSPFVLQDIYGLSPLGFSVAFVSGSLGFMLGTLLATQLVMHAGLDRTVGGGAMALAAGGLALLVSVALGSTSVAALVLPMTLYLFGLGLALPQAMAGALSPFPERAGAASSLIGFVQQSSAAILGAVVGHTLGQTAWPLAAPIAAMGCLALLVWTLSRRVRAHAGKGPP